MKKMFAFSTKTIVAIGLGAALFTLLYMFVKIPTGIPNVNIMTAYGVGGFFAALFGPIAGALIAFIGHFLSDASQGVPWMSWITASAVLCFITGLCHVKLKMEEGVFTVKDAVLYNVFQVVGNIIAWIIVAPVLDIVIYAEPVDLVFIQGFWAAVSNAVTMAVLGTALLFIYSKTRAQKGSLTTEE